MNFITCVGATKSLVVYCATTSATSAGAQFMYVDVQQVFYGTTTGDSSGLCVMYVECFVQEIVWMIILYKVKNRIYA